MRYIVFLLIGLFYATFSYAENKPIVSKNKDAIYIHTTFNGTHVTVFGILPQQKTKLNISVSGPPKKFTLHGKKFAQQTLILAGFYAGQKNRYKRTTARAIAKNYLYQTGFYHPAPVVSIKENMLFQSNIVIPATAPVGRYHINYDFITRTGKIMHKTDSFILKHQGLQKILYDIAMRYPVLNAILVIITAGLSSYILRFIFRKNSIQGFI